jgi:hypothetical protein
VVLSGKAFRQVMKDEGGGEEAQCCGVLSGPAFEQVMEEI